VKENSSSVSSYHFPVLSKSENAKIQGLSFTKNDKKAFIQALVDTEAFMIFCLTYLCRQFSANLAFLQLTIEKKF